MMIPECATKVKTMAQILKFDEAVRANVAQLRRDEFHIAPREQSGQVSDDFWPEVSNGLWVSQPGPVNPANAPGRVLSEMLLIAGGAGFLAFLASAFFGTPTP